MIYIFLSLIIIYTNNNILTTSTQLDEDNLSDIHQYNNEEISRNINKRHIFVGLDISTIQVLQNLSWLYRLENIEFGLFTGPVEWKDTKFDNTKINFALFIRQEEDRKCLLKPNHFVQPKALPVDSDLFVDIVEFINKHSFMFIGLDGKLNKAGLARQTIIKKLYHVKKNGKKCERISLNTKENFIEKFIFQSKPVILENAINHWPAIKKWSNDFLRQKYGNERVHIKLTEKGEFEGCDKADKFDNYHTFKIPEEVMKQLPYPDLVVVRPAVGDMKFSQFLDIIENTNKTYENISAYLEYSSIREYFAELEDDLKEIPVVQNILKLLYLNIWLSNGNTLGKLHFDPFDNFLCQIRGEKKLTLFEPHNNYNLYESHIQEALLSFDFDTKRFRNAKLLDSTSMVMSPVDINTPDLKRFSNFTNAIPLDCHLKEGDVLYMPAFWWHEVQSYPNSDEHRNLAVNFWYEPFLQKEFPCVDCKLDVNPIYRELIEKFAEEV